MPDFSSLCRFRLLWLTLCHLALVACAAPHPKVSYDYDPAADFTALKQFAWAEPGLLRFPDDPLVNNSLLDDRIKNVIEHQLLLKGIQRTDKDAPVFLVSYQIFTQKHDITSLNSSLYGQPYSYGVGFGFIRGPWYYDAMSNARWDEYKTYDLMVDFLHPATHKQLWRGILQNAVDIKSENDLTV
mgnify:CR=1 FL=1